MNLNWAGYQLLEKCNEPSTACNVRNNQVLMASQRSSFRRCDKKSEVVHDLLYRYWLEPDFNSLMDWHKVILMLPVKDDLTLLTTGARLLLAMSFQRFEFKHQDETRSKYACRVSVSRKNLDSCPLADVFMLKHFKDRPFKA